MAHLRKGVSDHFDNIGEWTSQQVAQFLATKGYADYANLFVQHKLTGERVALIKPTHLQEMGIQTIGDRLGIQKVIRELKTYHRQQEATQEIMKCTQAYEGTNIKRWARDNLCFCFPREPDLYVLSTSHLKIRSYHIRRFLGAKCGGCLGGMWTNNTIYLDRIQDIDTIENTAGMGCMAVHRCHVLIAVRAGVDAGDDDRARLENHELYLELEEGKAFASKLQHAMMEYKLTLSDGKDS
mmetsp:Transcript_121039/g.210132  ORF Transcript_121039/g.210132 Transcript_121039/m.210132 type:complete len:239 (-) Transcript_121039:124-840(-)